MCSSFSVGWSGMPQEGRSYENLRRDQNALDTIRLKHPSFERLASELTKVFLKLK